MYQRTTKYLVASFTTEDHLHTHGLDLPAEEIHGRARADCGYIICFQMIDDIWYGIKTLLDCKNILVVDSS